MRHALLALRESLQSSSEGLTTQNCAIGIIGENMTFQILQDEAVKPYVCI